MKWTEATGDTLGTPFIISERRARAWGWWTKAIALFEHALEVGASDPVYMFLASLKMQKGDRAGSLDALRQLKETSRRWVLGGHARRTFYQNKAIHSHPPLGRR